MALLTYEWRRAKSIRTTWITSFFVIASVAGFAYLATLVSEIDSGAVVPPLTEILTVSAANPIAFVLVASLAAMAFGHEYRYGTIRLTLTAFPKRPGVFFSKLFMTLLIPLAVAAVAIAAAYGVLLATGAASGAEVSWPTVAWQVAAGTVNIAVLAFSLTVITRNHPLGIIGPLVLSILESVLIALLSERFDWISEVLPFAAQSNWFAGGEGAMLGLGVWLAWMLGLLIVSFVLLTRRDA